MGALPHIAVGLAGAVRLVKLDLTGLDYYGDTPDDFWRSFLAAVVVAPLFLLYLVLRFIGAPPADEGFLHYVIAQFLAYGIAWLAFPLVMLHLSKQLGCRDKAVRYLVAYNWVSVLQNAVYLPIIILSMTGALAQGVGNLLAVAALMWVLGLTFYITRAALGVTTGTAAGIVFMDLLLGLLIETLT